MATVADKMKFNFSHMVHGVLNSPTSFRASPCVPFHALATNTKNQWFSSTPWTVSPFLGPTSSPPLPCNSSPPGTALRWAVQLCSRYNCADPQLRKLSLYGFHPQERSSSGQGLSYSFLYPQCGHSDY